MDHLCIHLSHQRLVPTDHLWSSLGAGDGGGDSYKRSAITKPKKECQRLEHLVSESVRWLLGKLSDQILTTAWKHPHCLNTRTHTLPTTNLPSAEMFSLHSHNCCLPCHPCLAQANSELIRGVLFSIVEVRHGEKRGDVANMRTQEEEACVVWIAQEKILSGCIQGRGCSRIIHTRSGTQKE